jgi:hypothetical protein
LRRSRTLARARIAAQVSEAGYRKPIAASLMPQLFTLAGARRRDPDIERWMELHRAGLGDIARHWFGVIHDCGVDVHELMHDGQATAVVGGVALAYVDAFKAHVNVGFFRGAGLDDPHGLLQGTGRFMRHVKIPATGEVDAPALTALIREAYADLKRALSAGGSTD